MTKFSLALIFSALAAFYVGMQEPERVRPWIAQLTLSEEDPPGFASTAVDSPPPSPINVNDRLGDPTRQGYVPPTTLSNPSNVEVTYELAEDGSGYYMYEKVGKVSLRRPSFISMEDYLRYRRERGISDYFRQQGLARNDEHEGKLIPDIDLGELGDIFGGGTVEIRPNGFVNLGFSIDNNRTRNPNLPARRQNNTTFNFDPQMQLGVTGKIGNLMNLNFNYDTQATFDFENQINLAWKGKEDQILQEVGAGNVSMPLGNTLIQGRQNLFGLKLGMRFGPVNITTVASLERGNSNQICTSGSGGVQTPFEQEVALYDEYRHYFLSHYFRSRYEPALENLPQVNSTVRINRIEVWINNNRGASTQNNRNAIGFVDLGENNQPVRGGGQGRVFNETLVVDPSIRLPDNDANNLYDQLSTNTVFRDYRSAPDALRGLGLQEGLDFERVTNMRLLTPQEYSFDPQLGYISLNQKVIANQVLFVAFEYTLNGQKYQVGEFSNDVPASQGGTNALFLKMLKPGSVKPTFTNNAGQQRAYPAWDLMMKNIYNIGYGISGDGFFLDVFYNSGTRDGLVNYLPTGPIANQQLLQVLRVDQLTNNTAPNPDNYFDYIPGRTVNEQRGQIIFPVLEPFGDWLRLRMNGDPEAVDRYVFDELYDLTQQDAIQLFPNKNRFRLAGYYSAAGGAEILLGTFNLPENSVTVTANGSPLVEGTDYQVDYFGGKVTILRQDLVASGQEICVRFENQAYFNVQNKTLLGARAEYAPTDEINLGLTIMNLKERPFTQKTTLGDEPFSNTIWGLDAAIRTESEWLTKTLDKLPLYSTKQTSNFAGNVEFAHFIPGLPSSIEQNDERAVYLDDFEGSKTTISLMGAQFWHHAAFPESNPLIFDPRQTSSNPLAKNFTRARLAWYSVDPLLVQGRGPIRELVPPDAARNNYTRQIGLTEIFPTAQRGASSGLVEPTLDLLFFPDQRGPYNYSTNVAGDGGALLDPEDNWGGITRAINTNNDFEATNVEFLEFWMMDPFLDDSPLDSDPDGGKLVINLGRVSEDILPDNSISLENGLPTNPNDTFNLDETAWGRVPIGLPPNQNFNNDPAARSAQDIGLDGLNNAEERAFFDSIYLRPLAAILGQSSLAYQRAAEDPSSDDFKDKYDFCIDGVQTPIFERYRRFNGLEGNSPVADEAQFNCRGRNLTLGGTLLPDNEDLNQNGSLSTTEEYYQYEIDIRREALAPGRNYVIDSLRRLITVAGNVQKEVTWYQFRVPLKGPAAKPINNISNLKSVDFVRMFVTGFQDTAVLRLAQLQFAATQWRRYTNDYELRPECPVIGPGGYENTRFEIGSVGVEENSVKTPFNYQIPPGINRQQLNAGQQTGSFLDNERSLLAQVEDLLPGDARGIFKNVSIDLRNYESLRMFVHAEAFGPNSNFIEHGDANAFIRLGLDNEENYYEYEIPLMPSDPFAPNPQSIFNVWPDTNQFDFELSVLTIAKQARDLSGTPPNEPFVYTRGLPEGHRVTIRGVPTLAGVRNVMVGVRNPRPCNAPITENVDLELWFNELRLTNISAQNAWAARGNVNIGLADLGQIQASISNKTPGFGGLEQSLSDQDQENVFRYDMSGNFALDKFLPESWGVNLPVYATYGEQIITPRFNPREPDVLTRELLQSLEQPTIKDSLRKEIQDYTRNQSIALTNIKIVPEGTEGKMPWSSQNFDFSYSFTERYNRSAYVEELRRTRHFFQINYRYQFPKLEFRPFNNWSRKNPISDFNLNLLPSSFTLNLIGNRDFEARQMRTGGFFGGELPPTFAKNFMLTQNYNLSWNLTQGLSVNFNAINQSRVDEVRGYQRNATQAEIDSVGSWQENLIKFGRDTTGRDDDELVNIGRTIGYTHNIALSYQLPLSRYKWTSYLSGNINYAGSFTWDQAPENNPDLGATIANSQTIQANGRIDLRGLYTKIAPVKGLLDAIQKRQQEAEARRSKMQRWREQVKRAKQKGTEIPPMPDLPPPSDTSSLRILKIVGQEVARLLLSVQDVNLTYSKNANTFLPGYLPGTDNFGLDFRYDTPLDSLLRPNGGQLPPTLGFVAGGQKDIRDLAGDEGWITQDTTLSSFFSQGKTERIDLRTSVELFKGFRVNISANRNQTENYSELFRWDPFVGDYVSSDRLLNGTFQTSYIFLPTAFNWYEPDTESETFQEFSAARARISQRLYDRNPYAKDLGLPDTVFQNGYSATNQSVLIPAFLASYSGRGADRVGLESFPAIPLPNWDFNYNLLQNLPALKPIFTALTIRHRYVGMYSIGAYNNNLDAELDPDGRVTNVGERLDVSGEEVVDFFPKYNIQRVQISEQFSPLIGLQANTKSGITSSLEYGRRRTMDFNTGALQLTENLDQNVSVTIGYRDDKLNWHFRLFGKQIDMTNSLNAQFKFTVNDRVTVNRILDSNVPQEATNGSTNIQIEPTIDYVINQRLNVQVFHKRNITDPYTSLSYYNSFSSTGFRLRFTLAN